MKESKVVDNMMQRDYIRLTFNGKTGAMSSIENVRASVRILVLGLISICFLTAAEDPPSDPAIDGKIEQGISLRQKGEFLESISVFDEALNQARLQNDWNAQVECLMNLGILRWNIGQVKDSNEIFHQALNLTQQLGLKDSEAKCAAYLKIYDGYVRGKQACASGLHQDSIAQFSAAIKLARSVSSPEHELKCLRQMSMNYLQTKMLDEFKSLNMEALDIARKINHFKEASKCLNNVGVYFYESNNYSKALAYYWQALSQLGEDASIDGDLSSILNNIGAIFRELGEYDKAIMYINRALKIDRLLADYDGISIELRNLAATHRRRAICSESVNDLYLSLRLNLESLDIAKKIKNKRYEIEAMNNIGLAYATNKDFTQALEYFRRGIKEAASIEYYSEACNLYANMGFAFMEKGSYGEAESSFLKGFDAVRKAGRYDVLWEIYYGLGACFEKKGSYETALIYYGRAVDTIDFMRSRLTTDDYKVGFVRDKLKAYEGLVNLLYKRKEQENTIRYDTGIIEVLEKAKARAFLEELSDIEFRTIVSTDSEYRKEEESLSRKISSIITDLIRQDLSRAQRQKLLNQLELEEDEHVSLLNRIKAEKTEYAKIVPPKFTSVERLQKQLLDEKSAFLEYYLGEKKSFGFLVTGDRFILRVLPPRAAIENSLRAFMKLISSPPRASFQGIPAAKRIYSDLIYPFQEGLTEKITHLIIVPDGILYYLPFEVLVRDSTNNSGPRYLVELYDISYAPSMSSLAYLIEKRPLEPHRKTLLLVGDPVYLSKNGKMLSRRDRHEEALREIYLNAGFDLSSLPYSKRELRQVAHCFRDQEVDMLSQSRANEEDIKKRALEEYRIIHFACHGFLDEKAPKRSALVLTLDDDPNEDGFLQAREISSLRLNADLVVLSACQTGKGRLENGEGVLGLPRSFFYAGARSTISSLWKVNDRSTSEIMSDFYRHFAAGQSKAKALRLAKLKLLKSRFSHPFYWAAFVLNGDYLSKGK